MAKEITIYTLDYCPYCMKAKIFFEEHKLPYKEISCEDDEDNYRQKLTKEFKLKSPATFPQIVIDGKHIGGWSDLVEKYNNKELIF